jgi:epoxyqueuosine reductase
MKGTRKDSQVSRREFLTGAGALAGLAVFGVGGPCQVSAAQQAPTWPCPCSCPCCGESFSTWEAMAEHLATEHLRKLPPIEQISEPSYYPFVVGSVARFDQKNEVFSRALWDEEYKAELAAVAPRPRNETQAEILEGAALMMGGIWVDMKAGTLHPKYTGFDGHVPGYGGLYGWDDAVGERQYAVSDPAQMSERIKYVARFYGASLVGICRIDRRWVYSRYYNKQDLISGELELPYKYAIVMGIEMDWQEIETAPGFGGAAASTLGYSQMAFVASSLAKYIRLLGYPAVPSGNDTTQSVPLAIDAGLGQLGRCGLLVSPQFGPRQRLCKVYTDLPLQPDQPIDFGLHAFCLKCGICARNCPAQAIRQGERTSEPTSISNRTGISRWPVNVTECYRFWSANGNPCAVCVAACPWGWPIRRWL